MKARKRQTAVRGRFSAMLISAAVHVAVLIAAGTFVAVTVVQRQEARFEGRQVSRPKMQLQRLQVPQRARMERQAPQMSQRVTAQAVSTRSVEFQMPEIAGLGGGISVDMSGAGFSGSLGFATPQLNLFGLRSQGEKVVFLLDGSSNMLTDEIGGIPAYQIVKDELIRMVDTLPPTALFNVIVFDPRNAIAFSENLHAAGSDAARQLREWIEPLNSHKTKYGIETLGSSGFSVEFEPMSPIFNEQYAWMAGISWAIQNQADTVYWLGTADYIRWIHKSVLDRAKRGIPLPNPDGRNPIDRDYSSVGGKERWEQLVAEANRMLEEENARRIAAGQPVRVLRSTSVEAPVAVYFPNIPRPRYVDQDTPYEYTADDVFDYIQAMMRKYGSDDRRRHSPGLGRHQMTFHVVQFVPEGGMGRPLIRLNHVARRLNGRAIQLQGLRAIDSARAVEGR